jgi:hypothetical protein
MKQVNLVEYLELISKGDEIYEIARDLVCSSGKNDSYYINISLEVLGDEFVKEDPLREAETGRELEIDRKYFDPIQHWAENLEFEELSEDIKEEIIKDIAEDDIELKIIKSVIENDFDLFLQIIKKYTYANINV